MDERRNLMRDAKEKYAYSIDTMDVNSSDEVKLNERGEVV